MLIYAQFTVRHPVGTGEDGATLWRYEPVDHGPTVAVVLPELPAVGDIVCLGDRERTTGRVVARQWEPAAHGSTVWPSGSQEPRFVSAQVVLEPDRGVFRNEAPLPDGPLGNMVARKSVRA